MLQLTQLFNALKLPSDTQVVNGKLEVSQQMAQIYQTSKAVSFKIPLHFSLN